LFGFGVNDDFRMIPTISTLFQISRGFKKTASEIVKYGSEITKNI